LSSASLDDFVLIRFKESAAGKAFSQSGMTGHSPDLVWFCKQHEPIGRKYQHLHSSEAMRHIEEVKNKRDKKGCIVV
jgi:hypothetical protein